MIKMTARHGFKLWFKKSAFSTFFIVAWVSDMLNSKYIFLNGEEEKLFASQLLRKFCNHFSLCLWLHVLRQDTVY